MLCRVPQALVKAQKTLNKLFAECDSQQRGFAEIYIGNNFFIEYFLWGTRQSICRAPSGVRQRKVIMTTISDRDGDFAEYTH
jgi:hypothetical protein